MGAWQGIANETAPASRLGKQDRHIMTLYGGFLASQYHIFKTLSYVLQSNPLEDW